MTPARVDLHVHSKHSSRPDEWLLRRIAAPESFTEPLELYRACRSRGMDFVTISDHDTVAGALEIAHLPGVFLSSEVTVSFPEDGCVIHCLVTGVSEAQHAEIQRLRHDVYALRDYLYDEEIVHSIAHPLYRVNDRLTVEHVEKLLVLFKRFEARNGIHDRHLNELAATIFGGLTPEILEDLAERHRLEPRGPEPWRKCFIGGSDDHGGLYLATTWTETPPAATVAELLAHLAAGDHAPGGEPGSALRLAQSLIAISHRYLLERFDPHLLSRSDPFARMLHALARPAGPRWRSWWMPETSPASTAPSRPPGEAPAVAAMPRSVEHAGLARANRACAEVLARTARKAALKLRLGRPGDAVAAVSSLLPAALALAPYAVAYRTQYKDERLLAAVRRRLGDHLPQPEAAAQAPKAWVTDTLADVNGVARTIQQIGRVAERRGRDLVTLTCERQERLPQIALPRVQRFEPLSRFPLPGYESLELAVPPVLEMLEHCERRRFDELIVSTPGPLGLAALAIARLLGLRLTAIYHTDFPLYVRHLTQDPFLEASTWTYMRWFFGQADRLYVPSRHYGALLAEHGVDPARIAFMPRGVDDELFQPGRRRPGFWKRFGLDSGPTLLYVGRISREKNLDLLLDAFETLRSGGRPAQLALVGDGPYLEELRRRRARPDVCFTGFLFGEELATAYASADLFAFPSTTDTFGSAVLEAMACGLPAVVTDLGGPREIVERHGGGRVVRAETGSLAAALAELVDHPTRRLKMAERAIRTARDASWEALLDRLWGVEEDRAPWVETPASEEAA